MLATEFDVSCFDVLDDQKLSESEGGGLLGGIIIVGGVIIVGYAVGYAVGYTTNKR